MIQSAATSRDHSNHPSMASVIPPGYKKLDAGQPWNGVSLLAAGAATIPARHMILANSDIHRWKLASGVPPEFRVPRNSLSARIRNFPRFQSFDKQWPLYVGLALTGLIYGGLHCLAWDAPFPSEIEQLLRRISSVTITSTGILVGMALSWEVFGPTWSDPFARFETVADGLNDMWHWGPIGWVMDRTVFKLYRDLPSPWDQVWQVSVGVPFHLVPICLLVLLKLVFDICVVVLTILYTLARVYLVVECFINLAHLPPSAYHLPQWTQYVPHIG